ncbi:NHL repeat-containing protein [Geobacter sp. AOG1]|uniref:NHL repeat-containing protein n=1 Tax=Geobacter sp. AOG1 TaxID=1566346 RepID=UPI001CC47673|nr:NHL repeat-containing protein [Geobacter sp. AOG1]GFE59089.1 hypothetical protein AOG1_29690 [Geobacter sp. AOG1]
MITGTIRLNLVLALLMIPVQSFSAQTTTLKLVQPVLTDAKEGMLKSPQGVACNKEGLFIVGDTGNGRLLTYTFKDDAVKGGGEVKLPQMIYPQRLQLNSKGEIFVLDGKLRRILRLSQQGAFIGFLDPQGLPGGTAPVPKSFKIDEQDNIYILDTYSERVIVLDPAGKYLKEVPFPSPHGFFTDLAVNAEGSIYLVDGTNSTVFVAEKKAMAFVPLTKSMKADMDFPGYITTDSRGNIYLVDQNGGGIIALGPDGSFRTRMLSMGWKPGLLYYPGQICLNNKGALFVADRDNNRVQIFEMAK